MAASRRTGRALFWKGSAIAAAVAVALLGGGCACESARCSIVDQSHDRFGSRTSHFGRFLGSLPSDLREEFALRGGRLGDYGSTWLDGRGLELERTGGHIVNFPGAVANDFRDHGGSLADSVGDAVTRTNEDLCCFFPRAWHVIRQALE